MIAEAPSAASSRSVDEQPTAEFQFSETVLNAMVADVARTWTIRDRGARADLAELASRNGISFQEAQRLILSTVAPDIADDIVRPQRVRGHRGLIRPLFDLHGDELERWTRRQLRRLAERLLLRDSPMLVSVPVDSLPSGARTHDLESEARAARAKSEARVDRAATDVAWLRSIATPSQRAIIDAWLEFSQLGEEPTHARVAAALGIDPATVRNQWHKLRARAKAARTARTATSAA